MPSLPRTTESFIRLVQDQLHHHSPKPLAFNTNGDLRKISAVLFLLGKGPHGEPLLILNKRSRLVPQSGDLCCPGGGISPARDRFLARWLHLPATPLARWEHGAWWRQHRRSDFQKLALLLAAGLREGLEEMRLNPLGVRFLGPMAAQHLVMFKRAIYPLVGWVNNQRRFFPNWEVDEIVRIPVSAFFDPQNYARYRISFHSDSPDVPDLPYRDMPCFIHRYKGKAEPLWGATYRITEQFLDAIFGFAPPSMDALPVFHRRLGPHYFKGRQSQ